MAKCAAYFERAAPRLAPAKFLAWAPIRGLEIVPGPGSNLPGRSFSSGRLVLTSGFLVFFPTLAFARKRALALVMCSFAF